MVTFFLFFSFPLLSNSPLFLYLLSPESAISLKSFLLYFLPCLRACFLLYSIRYDMILSDHPSLHSMEPYSRPFYM